MKFYERVEEETVVSWIYVPEHMCGYKTMVHGGIVATILDEIMSKTAAHFLHEGVVTKSISVDYLKPVTTGIEIRAEGKVVKVEKNKVFAEGGIFDGDNRIRARSTGIFAIVTPELMVRLLI